MSWAVLTTIMLREAAIAAGIPEEIANQVDSEEVLWDTALAAGGEGVAGLAYGLYRFGMNHSRRQLDMTKAKAKDMAAQARESIQKIRDLQKTLKSADPDAELNFSLGAGQLTQDPQLLVAQGEVMQRSKDAAGEALKAAEI